MLNLSSNIKLLNLKYLFHPICAFHVQAEGYEVYHHPPFLLLCLHTTGCKCKMMNFNQFNFRIHI